MNSKSAFSLLGSSSCSVEERARFDYYATDPKALELLLAEESFSKRFWECACGEGFLSKVLESHGYDVLSTDLVDYGYGKAGVDFLKYEGSFDGDIITNPPYLYDLEFV